MQPHLLFKSFSSVRSVLAASVITLASCQGTTHVQEMQEHGEEIRFSCGIVEYSTKVSDSSFDAGDIAGLFAGDPVNVSGLKLTWNGGGFIPESTLFWGWKQTGPTDFIAWYPYGFFGDRAPDITKNQMIEVACDQTDASIYSDMDLLCAKTTTMPGETVFLAFRHMMARLVLNLDSELAVAALWIEGIRPGAVIGLDDMSVTASSESTGFIPYHSEESGYYLIVPPQTCAMSVHLLLADGRELTYTSDQALSLESGKSTLGNLKVLADKEIEFSTEVLPWEEAGIFDAKINTPATNPEKYFVVTRNGTVMEMELTDPNMMLYKATINLALADGSNDSFRICNEDRSKEYADIQAEDSSRSEEWLNLSRVKSPHEWTDLYSMFGKGSFQIIFDAYAREFFFSEFEYLGEGTILESCISNLLDLGAAEWQVSYYQTIDHTPVYQVKHFLENSPWNAILSDGPGAGFIINAQDPDKIYLEGTYIGAYYLGRWPVAIVSAVEKYLGNGWQDYGSFSDGSFTFPPNGIMVALTNRYNRANYYGHTTFTLPGYTRNSIYVNGFDDMTWESVVKDGESVCRFAVTMYPDNVLLRLGVFKGAFGGNKEEIEAAVQQAKAGGEGFTDYPIAGADIKTYVDVALSEMGRYTVVAYTEGKDGSSQYRAKNIYYKPVRVEE